MHYLQREREPLETLLPGLDAALAAVPLSELEQPAGPGVAAFRAAGAPGSSSPPNTAARARTC